MTRSLPASRKVTPALLAIFSSSGTGASKGAKPVTTARRSLRPQVAAYWASAADIARYYNPYRGMARGDPERFPGLLAAHV